MLLIMRIISCLLPSKTSQTYVYQLSGHPEWVRNFEVTSNFSVIGCVTFYKRPEDIGDRCVYSWYLKGLPSEEN